MPGPEHPLMGKVSDLSDEEIQNKVTELNQKISFAYRMNNQAMINQLHMFLNTYNEEHQKRLRDKFSSDKKLKGKIDIAK
jgi:hypothetical protein